MQPTLGSLAAGSVVLGGALMLSALAVAGVALRKAADNFLDSAPQDRVATFFVALSFDRLSYALFAVAGVVLLGLVPLLFGVALWRCGAHTVLAAAGVVAGVLGLAAGLVQLTSEVDTFMLYLAASMAVTLWSLAVGVMLLKAAPAPRRRPA